MSKVLTCPKVLQTSPDLLSDIKNQLLDNESDHGQPIICKIIPSRLYVLFMIKDALNLQSKYEIWGFWRSSTLFRKMNNIGNQSSHKIVRFDSFFIENNLEIIEIVNGAFSSYFLTVSNGKMEIYYIGNDWEYQRVNQYVDDKEFKRINLLENLLVKGIKAGFGYLLFWTIDSEIYIFSQQEEKIGKIDLKVGMFIESAYCTFNSIFIHTFTQIHGEKNFELFYIPMSDEKYHLPSYSFLSDILNTSVRKYDLFSDNNERVKDIVEFNYILTQSNKLYQLEFDTLSDKFMEKIAIDLNKLNPNPVYNFSIGSGNNCILILSQRLDGNNSFSSFSIYHKGSMPVRNKPYASTSQTNIEPFKISMKSEENEDMGMVDMKVFSAYDMSFILIKKILSREYQLLSICKKLVNCHTYADIQIINQF